MLDFYRLSNNFAPGLTMKQSSSSIVLLMKTLVKVGIRRSKLGITGFISISSFKPPSSIIVSSSSLLLMKDKSFSSKEEDSREFE